MNTKNNNKEKINTKHPNYKKCGIPLTDDKLQEIFRLRMKGLSYNAIAKETNINWTTVKKYCERSNVRVGGKKGVPQPPINEQVKEVKGNMLSVRDYNMVESFLKSLNLLDMYKKKAYRDILSGNIPAVTTPLHIKQLIESERMIVTLPQDLNKAPRDFYSQIRTRKLKSADDEFDELGKAGDMEQAAG